MVSALTYISESNSPGSSPGWGHCVVLRSLYEIIHICTAVVDESEE